ncbi:YqeG family HAD IIIA-type phosphatase [Prochlorococcus sp. MIT 1307]|uniref:YqeG family HAD IIIA-type phosphatase n=1 Tax=Prochlorococcus sp. MIT 1307 TaxID=3096219 RepID=UPI002A7667F0|nr:YqeG family HAD IIIA-type phosphatase [Prochlorococcus sp. MIT 1307]
MKRNWLKPDWEPGLSLTRLPIKHLIDIGIKALILDVDGTLLPREEINIHNSVSLWIKEAKKNFSVHLLSNNPSKKRIEFISNKLEINFTYRAAKPAKGALKKVLIKLQQEPGKIAIIGDRLFTDVLAGKRLGLYTVLVKPLGPNGVPCKYNSIQRLEKSIAKLFRANK